MITLHEMFRVKVKGTELKKKMMAAAALMAGSAALWIVPVASAPAAQACVWDASWFFLHTCSAPPEPQGPPPPAQPPGPLVACDETHCGPDVPVPCSGPGAPC